MKIKNKLLLIFLFTLIIIFIGYQFDIGNKKPSSLTKNKNISPPPNFKVAFIADQGVGDNAQAVLRLIKNEEAKMVLHQGDLGYDNNPDIWEKQLNNILGENFPYFVSIGNHDKKNWTSYQQKLKQRLAKIKGAHCIGDLGVKSACTYQGLFFILSGVGARGLGHSNFIKNQLIHNNYLWKICSWHKNQKLMQAGDKRDEVGWGPYEECRRGGAIIATGHEHSYSRTYLMNNFRNQTVISTSKTLEIKKGETFAFVSGLGGKSIRGENEKLAKNPWWAVIYSGKQNADYGALFCIFNKGGIDNKAYCYFKNIDGNIIDEFNLIMLKQ